MPDLSVSLGKLKLANPVIVASGTFDCGEDYQDFVPLKKLGAIVTKTITLHQRQGNPPPRTAESYQGLLNAIGLENAGVDDFIRWKIPVLAKAGVPVIVSIAADTPAEFAELARRLSGMNVIAALELNISCPNLNKPGLIAQDAAETGQVVRAVRQATQLPLITKLSPNVSDITEIARAAEGAGSDILSLVNTFFALAVDIKTKRPKLGNVYGGLSGPAIKPQALWMVRKVFKAVRVPLIGMGGIMNAEDALEFMLCGASAVACGTVNFVHPRAAEEILQGIKNYLKENKIKSVSELTGSLC
ncbi:MAG: dihydroorotate dehydrogenase [Candidatus Omnitrophota bacterium]